MNPFFPLPHEQKIAGALREAGFTDSASEWVMYFHFRAKPIPIGWLRSTDPFLNDLYDRHPFHGGVLYSEPFTAYNWHVDDNRGVSVNMLIGGTGHCLFREESGQMVSNVTELDYAFDTYYLFNPQIEHMVINLDLPRFLFSLEFTEDKNQLTYDQLLREYDG